MKMKRLLLPTGAGAMLVGAILTAGGCGLHSHSTNGSGFSVHSHADADFESAEASESLAVLRAKFTVKDGIRYVEANGLPEHATGAFPNRGNPNSIREQEYRFQFPAKPTAAKETTSLPRGPFGIALNGVLFDPGTAELWYDDPKWNYDALSGKIDLGVDESHAHVQPNGAYHYHGIPVALIKNLGGTDKVVHIGYAADGFPIYGPLAPSDADDAKSAPRKMKSSYRLKKGKRPGSDEESYGPGGTYDGTFTFDWEYAKGAGDLDECNGRFGKTAEYPEGTYYYVVTDTYPFVPRRFRGTPDPSFRRGPQP